jgi:hypothetical protein
MIDYVQIFFYNITNPYYNPRIRTVNYKTFINEMDGIMINTNHGMGIYLL